MSLCNVGENIPEKTKYELFAFNTVFYMNYFRGS